MTAAGSDEFDDERFRALLNLAGPETAMELTSRLADDLSRVALALREAERRKDTNLLRSQSHVLLAIAGTIGANRLYVVSERLNRMVRAGERVPDAECLVELHALLGRVLARVRLASAVLVGKT